MLTVLVESDDLVQIKDNKNAITDLGTIEVKAHRTNITGEYNGIVTAYPSSTPAEVAEKALKGQALSHSAS